MAAKLVAKNRGGVISMGWGDPEVANEAEFEEYSSSPEWSTLLPAEIRGSV